MLWESGSLCSRDTHRCSGKMPVSQRGRAGRGLLSSAPFSSEGELKVLAGLPRRHHSRADVHATAMCCTCLLIEPLAPGAKSHFVCVIKVRAARKSRALLIRERHSCIVLVFRLWHNCHSKLPVRLNIELVVLGASIICSAPPSPPPPTLAITCYPALPT